MMILVARGSAVPGSAGAGGSSQRDPELIAIAERFTSASAEVASALQAYVSSPSEASRNALRTALSTFWASSDGLQALQDAGTSDAAFREFLAAYSAGW
jgi:hypothetical protein